MGFAGFAAEDPVGVEVGVVEEAHPHCWWDPVGGNCLEEARDIEWTGWVLEAVASVGRCTVLGGKLGGIAAGLLRKRGC